MASGEVSWRTAASAIAQSGVAACPRHQLLTWRAVTPAMREKPAWLTPARVHFYPGSLLRLSGRDLGAISGYRA